MAFFKGTATDYHDFLDTLKALIQDDHISVAVIFNGGTNYAIGDTITLAGGTKSHEPEIRVMDVSGGVITACHIADAGVYTAQASNPVAQNTTSGSGVNAEFTLTYVDTAWEVKQDYEAEEATVAAISAAGTGYTANDIVTIVGGSFVTAATVKILTVSGGVPQTIEVHTEAGNYLTTPSNPAATSGGTGSGLTLTMTWAAQVEENKYLMIHNTTSDQYIGWRALKETSPEEAYLLQCAGFTGFNSVNTPWEQQPGATCVDDSHDGTYVPLSGGSSPATITYWLSVQDLRIVGAFKVASVYPNMYLGGIDTFLTADEWAYPQLIMGCIAKRRPYTYGSHDFAGMNNPGAYAIPGGTFYPGPGWLRTPDGTLRQVANWQIQSGNPIYEEAEINISPAGGTTYGMPGIPNNWWSNSDNWREMFTETISILGSQQKLLRVATEFMLLPSTISSKTYNTLYGNMIGVFGFNPDASINAEDQIYIGSVVYRCFQNCNKSNRNFFFAIREN